MKTPARSLHLAALASLLALTAAAWAQDPSTPADHSSTPPPATAPATSDQPAAVQPGTPAQPAPVAAPATASEQTPAVTAPAAATPAPAPAAEAASSAPAASTAAEPNADASMRRLDTPAAPAPDQVAKDEQPAAPPVAEAKPSDTPRHRQRNRGGDNARVSIMHDATLAEGESADAVVSIFGSSTSAGRVADAVVSVLGSSTSSGDVGQAVVSVFGDTRVTGGEVGEAAVAVLGNNYINTKVHGDVVAVLGNVELGPKAEISGDLVCIGGAVTRDPAAIVHGDINNVSIGFSAGSFEGLHSWVRHCLVLGRPLAFAPHLMWAWWIALGALVLYLVLALLFPRGVVKCAETFEKRPGFSVLTAFLVALLTPAAAILLLITVVGAPALIIGLIAATLFGKAALLAWIGRRITLRFGDGPLAHPAFAVLIGGIIVLLLYTVPIVGFVVAKLLSWLGAGVAVFTLIQATKRSKPVAPKLAVPPATAAGIVPPAPVATGSVSTVAEGAAMEMAAVPPVIPASTATPPVISALSVARAGFWIRIAASALDVLVVGIATHLLPFSRLPDRMQPNFLVWVAAYCLVFWALRATTLGGIVCGLKVVRLDDRPVDWVTALVRTLGGFLSLFAAGVGFIWVAFDDQKQSWHDKIAGTTIVRVPKGVSLV